MGSKPAPAVASPTNEPNRVSPTADTKSQDDLPDEVLAAGHNRLASGWDGAIRFWGKVVDQDGKPVEGVRIVASAATMRVIPNPQGGWRTSTGMEAVSDAAGLFHLEGAEGFSLGIKNVVKEGYTLPPLLQGSPWDKFNYQYVDTGNSLPIFTPDPQQPVVIKLWRLVKPEPLLLGNLEIMAKVDGEPLPVKFVMDTYADPPGIRDFTMEAREITVDGGAGWEVTFRSEGGGFAEPAADDAFMFTAPAEGYRKEWKVRYSARQFSQGGGRCPVRFFFKCRDGKRHGAAEGTFLQPPKGGSMSLSGIWAVNPSGSRNLERDELKPLRYEYPWFIH